MTAAWSHYHATPGRSQFVDLPLLGTEPTGAGSKKAVVTLLANETTLVVATRSGFNRVELGKRRGPAVKALGSPNANGAHLLLADRLVGVARRQVGVVEVATGEPIASAGLPAGVERVVLAPRLLALRSGDELRVWAVDWEGAPRIDLTSEPDWRTPSDGLRHSPLAFPVGPELVVPNGGGCAWLDAASGSVRKQVDDAVPLAADTDGVLVWRAGRVQLLDAAGEATAEVAPDPGGRLAGQVVLGASYAAVPLTRADGAALRILKRDGGEVLGEVALQGDGSMTLAGVQDGVYVSRASTVAAYDLHGALRWQAPLARSTATTLVPTAAGLYAASSSGLELFA